MFIFKRINSMVALLTMSLLLLSLCSCSAENGDVAADQGSEANTQNTQVASQEENEANTQNTLGTSQEESEHSRIEECEELIDNISEITLSTIFDYSTGTYIYDQYSFEAFEKADKYYNRLTDEEKAQVSNIDMLEEQRPNYLALAEKVSKYKIMQEIYLASKEEFVKEIKERLKDPSSFQEVSYYTLMLESKDYNGDFEFQATFTFSATNSYGGRLQEEWRGTVSGIYENKRVKEIAVNIWSMG